MTNFEIITLVFGSGLILGVIRLLFLAGKFAGKVDSIGQDVKATDAKIDKAVQKIESRFDKIDVRLEDVKDRLSRLEGEFAERGRKIYRIDPKEEPKEG